MIEIGLVYEITVIQTILHRHDMIRLLYRQHIFAKLIFLLVVLGSVVVVLNMLQVLFLCLSRMKSKSVMGTSSTILILVVMRVIHVKQRVIVIQTNLVHQFYDLQTVMVSESMMVSAVVCVPESHHWGVSSRISDREMK